MSRSRVFCIGLAAIIVQVALLVVSESTVGAAQTEQPKGKTDQPKSRKPRAPNDAAAPKPQAKKPLADPNLLSMELKALRILRALEARPHQLNEIARAAKKTAGNPGQRESAKVSDPYVEAMGEMRRALIANDGDKIEQLRTRFDELEEKSPPDLDDQVEITDGAEIEAVRLLNIFSPQQVVAYAQSLEDDFPDPVQLILVGLKEGRSLQNAEWETARNKITEEVGWLVYGSQGDKATKLEEQVSAFLDKNHGQGGGAGVREAEVRQLVGTPGPVVVLKNIMEHTLAELLANPQVERAAQDCLRHDKPPAPAAPKPSAPAPKSDAPRPHHGPSKGAETGAKRVELDDVAKAPDQYEGQEVQFDHVTVTGTAPGKSPVNLWLAVKTQSGTLVEASRDQKLTVLIPVAKAPDVIKELKSGGAGISVTLTCTVHRDTRQHWNARVQSIEVHQGN
jgi:hypothetical protein